MDNSEKFDSGLAWNAAITTAVTVTVVAIRAKVRDFFRKQIKDKK